jgi:hypothetical protein
MLGMFVSRKEFLVTTRQKAGLIHGPVQTQQKNEIILLLPETESPYAAALVTELYKEHVKLETYFFLYFIHHCKRISINSIHKLHEY